MESSPQPSSPSLEKQPQKQPQPSSAKNRKSLLRSNNVQNEGVNGKANEELALWPKFAAKKSHMKTFAKYCPLISATLAPLSTVMDIPALTQRWYSKGGITQSDPTASLVLSAIGLALNVIANILLVVRFSSKKPFWVNRSTRWSLLFWLGKTIVAAVNLILFGILTRNADGYKYLEGFWCAVVSIIDSGIICSTLLFHYFLAFGHAKSDTSDIRSEGRRFMLSVTAFLGILAIQSLVFSQIEGWDYVSGIYMSVQTALTIGYGDYVPTTTAGKVLIFPFAVLTISQLGNEIALIIGYIAQKSDERKDQWRRKFEDAMHREANTKTPRACLTDEMALVYRINAKEEMMNQLYDVLWSALALIVFWVLGATAFSQIEGWTYGNAIYMCMILSLTIGFGDFTPSQPGGKVVFIVYALMAVPIVTSFAVQTITGILSTFSQRGVSRQLFIVEQERSPEAFAPHSHYIAKYHKSYADLRDKALNGSTEDVEEREDEINNEMRASHDTVVGGERSESARESLDVELPKKAAPAAGLDAGKEPGDEGDIGSSDTQDQPGESRVRSANQDSTSNPEVNRSSSRDQYELTSQERKLEVDLLRQLLDRVVEFEVESRQMLLECMDQSVERTLLLADRNVQIRDVRALRGDSANMIAVWAGEGQDEPSEADPDKKHEPKRPDMLQRVSKYRSVFAEILVLGSLLQKLEGAELKTFERLGSVDRVDEGDEDGETRESGDSAVEGDAPDLHDLGEKRYDGLIAGMVMKQSRKLKGGEKRGDDIV